MSFHKLFDTLDPVSKKRQEAGKMAPGITEIGSAFEFENIMKSLPPTQLMVIDFHATWCGPCHAIAPVFAQLASKYQHVKFVKVDVDKQQQIARQYRVTAMPTFKFIKGGREVDEIRGASPPQLNAKVAQHAGPVPATPATASGSGSASTAASSAPKDNTVSLLSHITSNGLTCLNESSSHPLSSIIGPSAGPKGRSYLESDVDPELLISIPFQDQVRLKAISIFSGVSPAQAPKSIKLYINNPNMDFDNAESSQPAQEIELKPGDVKGDRVDLRFVRFQNVRTLQILVKSNQEDEETTRIDSIDVFGTAGETSDKGPLPKVGDGHDH